MADGKESLVLYTLEASGKPSTNHDDKITFRFKKGDYPTGAVIDGVKVVDKGIGLSDDWRYSEIVEYEYKDGAKILDGYHNGLPEPNTAYMRPKEYDALPLPMKSQWQAYYKKSIPLADGVKLAMESATVALRITNLFGKLFDSRYGMAIKSMAKLVDEGVLKYKPSVGEPTDNNKYNAIRQRILRAKQMFEYEHDTLLVGSIGKPIYDYIKEHPTDKMILKDNTIYVQGHGKTSKTVKAVKMYDAPARDGMEPGRLYKIETTLYTKYFNDNKVTIDSLTKQPEIMELIKDELECSIVTVLKILSPEVMIMTAEAYRVDSRDVRDMPRQIARAMLGNTLSQDVAELKQWRKEKDIEDRQRDRDIAALKRATGLK